MTRNDKRLFATLVTLGIAIGAMAAVMLVDAQANGGHTLTVDGTEYTPTKIVGSGPTVHYFTPGVNSVGSAFTERHTWTGNGSGNLPCVGLLHWIDNANVLTISHCEFENGTTTTTTQVTTTTTPEVTTTTQVVTTTTSTTQPTTTTTVPRTTSTTVEGSTTTTTTGDGSTTSTTVTDESTTSTTLTLCGKGGDAPCGGVATGGGACAAIVSQQVEAPGPITTCNGSGAGWEIAFWLLIGAGLLKLSGGMWWSWRTHKDNVGVNGYLVDHWGVREDE